jgi:flagellar biogenesis protein FliO
MSRAIRGTFGAVAAALLVSTSALAAPDGALADAPEFIGPPPPPVAAPAAAAPAVPVAPAPVAALPTAAPRAAGSARATNAWLRQSARPAAEKLETKAPMSPLRVGAMLVLVAALGGGAYYARRRRKTAPVATASEKLRVLGSTRVGPKAFAVVAEVGGKRLLLGVTDQAVNTLAWLEDGADEEERADRASYPAPVRREADETLQGPSGFLRVLRSAVGSGDARKVAVDEIANSTRDEVTLSRRSKPQSSDELEGQVKGLARRRRRDPS